MVPLHAVSASRMKEKHIFLLFFVSSCYMLYFLQKKRDGPEPARPVSVLSFLIRYTISLCRTSGPSLPMYGSARSVL